MAASHQVVQKSASSLLSLLSCHKYSQIQIEMDKEKKYPIATKLNKWTDMYF